MVPVQCPMPCQPPWLCPCKEMESASSREALSSLLEYRTPLSLWGRRPYRHSGFFSNLTTEDTGCRRGKISLPSNLSAHAGRRDQKERWGEDPVFCAPYRYRGTGGEPREAKVLGPNLCPASGQSPYALPLARPSPHTHTHTHKRASFASLQSTPEVMAPATTRVGLGDPNPR